MTSSSGNDLGIGQTLGRIDNLKYPVDLGYAWQERPDGVINLSQILEPTRVRIPPIKIQGIKSKLVPFIMENTMWRDDGRWVEPFLGSGVVMFNMAPSRAVASELNPHIVDFYRGIQDGSIGHAVVRRFLEREGMILSQEGESYYYEVRDRFNSRGDPLDFLFLNRACFNGLMRFNSKGRFNVPFCKKPGRFTKSYITKIANQVRWTEEVVKGKRWVIKEMDWKESLEKIKLGDFLYLDPPYYGRSTNYYDVWVESDIRDLADFLRNNDVRFALSLWHSNKYRKNPDIKRYFSGFTIKKHEHFYHLGASEDLRNTMTEVLIMRL